MSVTREDDVRKADAESAKDVSNERPGEVWTYALAGIALIQAASLTFLRGSTSSAVAVLFFLSWIGGIIVVVNDVRQRRSADDPTSRLWALGALVPIFSSGVIAAYALARFGRHRRHIPWHAVVWLSFVVPFGSLIMGPETSGSTSSVLFSTFILTNLLTPLAVYADAKTLNRTTQESLSTRMWTVLTAVWGFNVLTVPLYSLVRYRHVRNATNVGEALDRTEEGLATGNARMDAGEFAAARDAFGDAGDALEEVDDVDPEENPALAERLSTLRERLSGKRETAREREHKANYESATETARSKFGAAESAAADEEHGDAAELAAEAAGEAEDAVDHAGKAGIETDEAMTLRDEARDLSAESERRWFVARINDARSTDAENGERAIGELEEVLAALDDTEALSGQNLELVREEAREAYATVLADEAQARLDDARTRANDGDFDDARAAFSDAVDRATVALDRASERGVEAIDELERVRETAERRRGETYVAEIERQLAEGIETFRDGRYESARDAFTAAAEDAADATEAVDDGELRDRLAHLRSVAEENADAARRAVLGIGDGTPTVVEPDEGDGTEAVRAADAAGDADTGSAADTAGAPDAVPVAPDADVEYAAIDRGDRLGEGGSAEVFRATLDDGEIDAALKEPRMQGTLHADTMESFVEEAETWAGLDNHDFVVGVIDWDDEPLPWMLLEYMDGGDLSNYAGELPFEQAVWTARCVSDGVQHAHSRGVAHLDLKPENVLFRTTDGGWPVPKVADWGLARALLHDDGGVEGLSPRYAAPEQVDADRFGDPDQSTDVYQLGAVFYDLFVGHPPFEGEGGEVLTRVVEDDIRPPSEADPSLPAELDDVLMPALEREKEDRYESVLYLRDALADLADETRA